MAIYPYQDIQGIQEHYASCSQDDDKVNKIQDYFQNTEQNTLEQILTFNKRKYLQWSTYSFLN